MTVVRSRSGELLWRSARLLALCLGIAGLAAAADAASPQSRLGPADGLETCSRAKIEAAEAARDAAAAAKNIDDPSSELTDVQHYRLELDVDPGAETVTGRNVMTVRSRADGLESFRFWLHGSLAITAVEVDGSTASYSRGAAGAVDVALGRSYDTDGLFELEVRYQGRPVTRGFFGTQGGAPLVYTFSQPWHAMEWWPVKDDTTDKATGELLITVPSELTVVSNGTLVGVDTPAFGRRRFHWSTSYPTSPYLFAFAATDYTVFSGDFTFDGGEMPVELYVYPASDTPEHREAWLQTIDMLGTYGELFGPYPFLDEKYAIYQFGFGGGMEHQTATGQGDSAAFMELTTAHELAHQWWGDMVTCDDWHHIWLNEGFATYAVGLWHEYASGTPDAAALRDYMEWARPSEVEGSVYVEDATDHSQIFSPIYSYRKAAWVLHMLRGVVGTDTFFAILHAYRERFAYRTVTTEDFRAVAEEVWGGDLGWFFDRWIYGGGAPAYRYGWRRRRVGRQRFLEISLRQAQDEEVFEMPLTVEVRVLGESRRLTIFNDEREEHFLLPVEAPVEAVELDPDGWILTRALEQGAFVDGPPRIVGIVPEPGANLAPGEVLTGRLTFHEDVVLSGADITLEGPDRESVEIDVDYDSETFTATVVSAEPLAPGRYELVVHDDIVAAESGIALDGELGEGRWTALLPSGDGVAGGAAVVRFSAIRRLRPSGRLHPTAP